MAVESDGMGHGRTYEHDGVFAGRDGDLLRASVLRRRVLAELSLCPRSSAIDILRALDLWLWQSGKLYAVLYSLEAEGVITSEFVDGPHPRRRVYWIV